MEMIRQNVQIWCLFKNWLEILQRDHQYQLMNLLSDSIIFLLVFGLYVQNDKYGPMNCIVV